MIGPQSVNGVLTTFYFKKKMALKIVHHLLGVSIMYSNLEFLMLRQLLLHV